MLTSAQLDRMRATTHAALPETCTIQRKTAVSDGGGGTTTSWVNQAAGVPCRVAPAGGGETGTAGDRISDETTHIVTLPAQTEVTEADRLVIAGQTYESTAVRKRGAWEVTRRVEAREAP